MKKILINLILLHTITTTFAQHDSLRSKIASIINTKNATIGVAIYNPQTSDTINFNNGHHLPMHSVFKFPIGLAVLHAVDKGKLRLSQKIYVKKSDLLPDTWSPIRDRYPEGNVYLTLAEILKYTISQSDNNGCDILLRLITIKAVNDYMHELGIADMDIKVNEEDMHKTWAAQYANWTTPSEAVKLLELFYNKKLLSKNSHNFLWQAMLETSVGKNRIKGQLPANIVVAHRPGTSGTNEKGMMGAVNDIGIILLPNNSHFTISVFVSDTKESLQTNEKIIADITKLAWETYKKPASFKSAKASEHTR